MVFGPYHARIDDSQVQYEMLRLLYHADRQGHPESDEDCPRGSISAIGA